MRSTSPCQPEATGDRPSPSASQWRFLGFLSLRGIWGRRWRGLWAGSWCLSSGVKLHSRPKLAAAAEPCWSQEVRCQWLRSKKTPCTRAGRLPAGRKGRGPHPILSVDMPPRASVVGSDPQFGPDLGLTLLHPEVRLWCTLRADSGHTQSPESGVQAEPWLWCTLRPDPGAHSGLTLVHPEVRLWSTLTDAYSGPHWGLTLHSKAWLCCTLRPDSDPQWCLTCPHWGMTLIHTEVCLLPTMRPDSGLTKTWLWATRRPDCGPDLGLIPVHTQARLVHTEACWSTPTPDSRLL